MATRIEAGVIGGYDDYECDEDLYCPQCGKQGTVWVSSGYDYYQGASHLCIACDLHFTMPTFEEADEWAKKKIDAIRKALSP